MEACRLLTHKWRAVSSMSDLLDRVPRSHSWPFLYSSSRKRLRWHAGILFAGNSLTHFNWCVVKDNKYLMMTDGKVPRAMHIYQELYIVHLFSHFVDGKAVRKIHFLKKIWTCFGGYTTSETPSPINSGCIKMTLVNN